MDHGEVVKILLNNGPHVNLQTEDGWCALMRASKMDMMKSFKYW